MHDPIPVTVREVAGAYFARAGGKQSSSTAHAACAAARAAGRALGVRDTEVGLKRASDAVYYAIPVIDATAGYVSALTIMGDDQDAYLARTNPARKGQA